MFKSRKMRVLMILSTGLLFAGVCSSVMNTLGLAFNIADIWA